MQAAAEVFCERGYSAASMQAIAAKVGISAPALYRHYPSKYEMFAAALLSVSQRLVDCTDFVDAVPDSEMAAEPAAALTRVVHALIDVTLANRRTGALYRWQARYLHPVDHARLVRQMQLINRRVQRPLQVLRPSLTSPQQWMLSTGILSVIASIADHQIRLPADTMHPLLAGAASALYATQPPESGAVAETRLPIRPDYSSGHGPAEAVLRSAMQLFAEQGYAETSMAQISATAGLPLAQIYRHYAGKAEILAVALRRATDWNTSLTLGNAGGDAEPRQTLGRLLEHYVATLFESPELSVLYFVEQVHLMPRDRDYLRRAQLSMIATWVQLLTAARPGLGATQAWVLVYAVRMLVVDLVWLARYQREVEQTQLAGDSAQQQACVSVLAEAALFGDVGVNCPELN